MSSESVVLTWTFKPSDYFEQPISISRQDYAMSIGQGTVEAAFDAAVYDADPSVKERLHASLNDRFRAVELVLGGRFKSSN
jgi:hypothetical protein